VVLGAVLKMPFKADPFLLSVGMAWQVLFIPLTLGSMRAFRCIGHPEDGGASDKSSLLSYMDVECGSDDHASVQVFGAISILLYIVLPFALLVKVSQTLKATNGAKPDAFRYEFIFTRFGRERPLSPLGFMSRNLVIAIIGVIIPGGPAVHAIVLSLWCAACAVYVSYVHPWQDSRLNFADTITLLLISCVAGWSSYMAERTDDGIATIGFGSIISCLAVAIIFVYLARLAFVHGPDHSKKILAAGAHKAKSSQVAAEA